MIGRAARPWGIAPEASPLMGGAGIALAGDDKLVRACLSEGGFPTAVETAIGTVWAGPDGLPWSGKLRKRRRA